MVDTGIAHLFALPDLGLYRRGRLLVRIVREVQEASWGSDLPTLSPVILQVSEEYLRECLARSARWIVRRPGKSDRVTLPPTWLTKGILARGEWPFFVLEGVVQTPVLRADGRILDEPGYDLTTRLYFDPGRVEFPPVPDFPSQVDAQEAWEKLRALFADFPFVGPSDLSALLAAFLSLVGRHAIAGPCPMTAIGAPVPGSGKTLAADAISVLATGRPAPRMPSTRDDEEMRKRILSLAIEGASLVLIDNVEGAFGSASIAAQLTGGMVTDRILKSSQMVSLSFRPVWLVTGNNLQFKGDLQRRIVPCDMDPRTEHPEDRTGFQIPDLLTYLAEHRAELVVAGLTILRAFHCADRPSHGRPPKGAFEEWDALIRGALIWVGAADPLEGQERLRETGDVEHESLRAVIGAWSDRFGTDAKTLAEVLQTTNEPTDSLRIAFAELCGCDLGQLNATKIGHALRRVVGRVVAGRRFERDPNRVHGSSRWKLVPQGELEGEMGGWGG